MKCHSCGSENTMDSITGGERGIKCNECGFNDNLLIKDKEEDLNIKEIFMSEVMKVLQNEADKQGESANKHGEFKEGVDNLDE